MAQGLDETLNNGRQAIINRDTANIFVWNNRTVNATYTAAGEETLVAGTLMGRVSATGKVAECDPDASDGTEYPLGFVLNDQTFTGAGDREISIVTSGDVVESLITLGYGVTLNDVVDGRRLRDHLTPGINLVGGEELSAFDNQ